MAPLSRETVVALLAIALLATSTVAVLGSTATATQSDPQVSPTQDGIATNWTMAVQLQENGNAVWMITTSIPLDSAEDREAYRELASEFETGERNVFGLGAFERASAQASDAAGREMEIANTTKLTATEAQIENGTGLLGLQFTWENFARVEADRLHIDDVLATENGVWLPRLNAGETLVIRPPDGYGVLQSNVVPGENATLRWTGPVEFDESSLEATFIGNSVQDDATDNETDTTTGEDADDVPDDDDGSTQESSMLPWLLGGGALLLVVAVVAYFAARDNVAEQTVDDGGTAAGDAAETDDSPPPAGGAQATAESDSTEDDVDVELLSDEERVTRLLEQNGGRMKQATIVKETDWSNAKVSQLLSSMEEEDKIDKLRIGRENLISFPEEDVADIQDE